MKGMIAYTGNVHMTPDQHRKLCEELGGAWTRRAIEILEDYKSHGEKHEYEDDYQAILNWILEQVEEEKWPARQTV